VTVGDYAILGGMSAACISFAASARIALSAPASMVVEDVIPFGAATGNRAVLSGLNLVGLKRRGFDRSEINALRAPAQILVHRDRRPALMTRLAKAAQAAWRQRLRAAGRRVHARRTKSGLLHPAQ
jgi:acyl-[acyl carrier protein]--UDP-N-acetylglucosamine O-acyltransferase